MILALSALRAPFEATTHLQLANKIRSGNLDRIPSQYSDDLMKIIRVMLEQKADKRPNVSDLLAHEQVQVRILEKKYKDKYAYLKKKEYEIQKREKALSGTGIPDQANGDDMASSRTEQIASDQELIDLEDAERRLMAEIERTERENQEIDQCMKQNCEIIDQLKDQISTL